MDKIEIAVTCMNALLTFGSLCMMLFAFKTFLQKPRTNLETRVTTLEVEVKEVKSSLQKGNDKFRHIGTTHKILLQSILALIEFEMSYCLVEHKEMSKDLIKAKEELHRYLAESREAYHE